MRRKGPVTRERTPGWPEGGVVLESQRIRRRIVMGIAALLFSAAAALALWALTFAPGEIEITGISYARVPEMSGQGRRYGATGRIVEEQRPGAALYDSRGNYVRLLDNVSTITDAPKGRVPVYYSRIWRSAVYPRNPGIFRGIGVLAAILAMGGFAFVFTCREHLKLTPHRPKADQDYSHFKVDN